MTTAASQSAEPVKTHLIPPDEDGGFDSPSIDAGAMQIATTRSAQEVQAAVIVAKRFPRDEQAAFTRIVKACKRKALAERATYAYKRGGSMVTGPSIRLAEVLAQSWGNMSSGIVELEQRDGESVLLAYAWDLETNRREEKVFTVKHERHTKERSYALTDPRDIYEVCANNGARRLRACILAVIPGDITEAAVAECERTLSGDGKEPLTDRARKMVAAFAELGITKEMIEGRLTHPTAAIVEAELSQLRAIFTSIRDGVSRREEWFDVGGKGANGTGGGGGSVTVDDFRKLAAARDELAGLKKPALTTDKDKLELARSISQATIGKPMPETHDEVEKVIAALQGESIRLRNPAPASKAAASA